jgi:hypothetical protein
MKQVIFVLLVTISSTILFAQPTGAQRLLNFKLVFTDNSGNAIRFNDESESDTLYSIDKTYKIVAYTKYYFLRRSMNLDCFYENYSRIDTVDYFDYFKAVHKDSLAINKIKLYYDLINRHWIDSILRTQIWASTKERNYYIPKEDLIIHFLNGYQLMTVYFEIYKIPIPYIADFNFTIPFQEGIFKITDFDNPQLIRVFKEDERE